MSEHPLGWSRHLNKLSVHIQTDSLISLQNMQIIKRQSKPPDGLSRQSESETDRLHSYKLSWHYPRQIGFSRLSKQRNRLFISCFLKIISSFYIIHKLKIFVKVSTNFPHKSQKMFPFNYLKFFF